MSVKKKETKTRDHIMHIKTMTDSNISNQEKKQIRHIIKNPPNQTRDVNQ